MLEQPLGGVSGGTYRVPSGLSTPFAGDRADAIRNEFDVTEVEVR